MEKSVREIVSERILILLSLAKKIALENPARAKRYVGIAVALCKRHNFRLGKEQKLQFCKKCLNCWVLGRTVRVRLNKRTKSAEYVCKFCGAKRTLSYAGKKN